MKLENRFTVPVPVDQAWQVLLDVERVAPCMPGATLTSIDGDRFEGTVKVKVGPINLTYGGKASFVSKDDVNHVAVIDGAGKETRGTGTAKALITCRLVDRGANTEVEVDTDLNVTGKPAQFGRGVLADVSAKLIDQFAACLSDEISAGEPAQAGTAGEPAQAGTAGTPAEEVAAQSPVFASTAADLGAPAGLQGDAGAAASAAEAPAAPRPPRPPAEAIDLLGTAGAPVLKRLAPLLAGLAVVLLVLRRLRR
jgi:carbon monoxide dehydrogenase subunit G